MRQQPAGGIDDRDRAEVLALQRAAAERVDEGDERRHAGIVAARGKRFRDARQCSFAFRSMGCARSGLARVGHAIACVRGKGSLLFGARGRRRLAGAHAVAAPAALRSRPLPCGSARLELVRQNSLHLRFRSDRLPEVRSRGALRAHAQAGSPPAPQKSPLPDTACREPAAGLIDARSAAAPCRWHRAWSAREPPLPSPSLSCPPLLSSRRRPGSRPADGHAQRSSRAPSWIAGRARNEQRWWTVRWRIATHRADGGATKRQRPEMGRRTAARDGGRGSPAGSDLWGGWAARAWALRATAGSEVRSSH